METLVVGIVKCCGATNTNQSIEPEALTWDRQILSHALSFEAQQQEFSTQAASRELLGARVASQCYLIYPSTSKDVAIAPSLGTPKVVTLRA